MAHGKSGNKPNLVLRNFLFVQFLPLAVTISTTLTKSRPNTFLLRSRYVFYREEGFPNVTQNGPES